MAKHIFKLFKVLVLTGTVSANVADLMPTAYYNVKRSWVQKTWFEFSVLNSTQLKLNSAAVTDLEKQWKTSIARLFYKIWQSWGSITYSFFLSEDCTGDVVILPVQIKPFQSTGQNSQHFLNVCSSTVPKFAKLNTTKKRWVFTKALKVSTVWTVCVFKRQWGPQNSPGRPGLVRS